MNESSRTSLLRQVEPRISLQGEPLLGSSYGEEEIEAAVAAMRDSMEVTRGFGSNDPQILDFEAAFAVLRDEACHLAEQRGAGARHGDAVSETGAGR